MSATVEGRRVGVGNAAFVRATLSQTQSQTAEEGEGEEDMDMPPRLRAARKVRA